ncbi:DNA ligase [Neptunomonas marina]|uniref:DNA ligase n=1 Tax=Neptunomonas marina TaxID=1815562 RepID=A0A437Q4X6_9GAMM|nr:DNA ligase [Neptunomonas marina]RVU29554.1 DNA ligase [Neptunomonas marina]
MKQTNSTGIGLVLGVGLLLSPSEFALAQELPLQLPKSADERTLPIDYAAFWFAEKFDGVRGYWDGKQMLTRSGQPIAAPQWFIDPLPSVPVEGELWIERGRFSEVSGIVRQTRADAGWEKVRFMVFDLPAHRGRFEQRYKQLSDWVTQVNAPHIQLVPVDLVVSEEQLQRVLTQTKLAGGEGLMLYRRDSYYALGRTDNVLKLKGYEDAEGVVMGYTQGKGKYTGLVGALIIQFQGQELRIGSGLSDQDRREPPPIGTVITFRYNGLTRTGLPRFARFHRIRTAY